MASGASSVKKAADPQALLREGLAQLHLDTALHAPLLDYLQELRRWNAAYNLTAVRDPAQMVTRHLLDSLAVLPALDLPAHARLLDVGSGAGLPGLPLALARPDWTVHVLDSNGKKARFLRHAVRTLALANVEVIESRAELHAPAQPYDGVISRAFASLADFVHGTQHLLAARGRWLAMKGRLDENELAALPARISPPQILPLSVPGLDEARHLIVFTRADS